LAFLTGKIRKVFPPSDLNRFGIHRGDRVLAYQGHKFHNGWQMVRDMVGAPGTTCDITFLHDGQIIIVYPHRIDSRLLVPYEPWYSHHYRNCAAQTRYW